MLLFRTEHVREGRASLPREKKNCFGVGCLIGFLMSRAASLVGHLTSIVLRKRERQDRVSLCV